MYGQQFSNPIASAAKWMFFGFFGVILMAALLGANVKDAKWLNSDIAEAEAQRIQIEAAHQQATYELQEQLAQAQTVAEIQAIQREQKMLDAQFEHDMQILAQDVANRQRWTDATINLVIFGGGATGIAAVISALILAVAKAIAILRSTPKNQPTIPSRSISATWNVMPLPEPEPYDPWESPARRYERRLAERQQELTARQKEPNEDEMVARMKAVLNPARMSTEEYNKRPLAG